MAFGYKMFNTRLNQFLLAKIKMNVSCMTKNEKVSVLMFDGMALKKRIGILAKLIYLL